MGCCIRILRESHRRVVKRRIGTTDEYELATMLLQGTKTHLQTPKKSLESFITTQAFGKTIHGLLIPNLENSLNMEM